MMNWRIFLCVFICCTQLSSVAGGKCQDYSTWCSGQYQSSLCPGTNDIRCCVHVGEGACTAVGGTCKDINDADTWCNGNNYLTGKCPGASNIKCCVPTEEGACTAEAGTCQKDNTWCSGNYESGKCPGAGNIRCCIPSGEGSCNNAVSPVCQSGNTDYGDFTSLSPNGAGTDTSTASGLSYSGVAASNEIADWDCARRQELWAIFTLVGNENCISPYLIAALASRESRIGKPGVLDANGYGDNGNGYGIMQLDINTSGLTNVDQYEYNSYEHVNQAIKEVLIPKITAVQANKPNWSLAQQLQGGVAAYNFGVSNVQSWSNLDGGTTGDDYSGDVIARAQRFKDNLQCNN